MKTIWKYPLQRALTTIFMPTEAKILTLQVQLGAGPCLWVAVDTDKPPTKRTFALVGTGHELPEGTTYIGTWQEPPFVWHLFEASSEEAINACKD